MRIDGQWLVGDDGVVRPVISGDIRTADGSWEQCEFLVDTGADRTVFSAATLARLALQPLVMPCVLDTFFHLGGFGLYTQLGPHDTIHFGEVH